MRLTNDSTSVGRLDLGLDDGEFVAAEPCDQIARLEAAADAARDRLQQLVADVVAEESLIPLNSSTSI